jgi:hypothetical protein
LQVSSLNRQIYLTLAHLILCFDAMLCRFVRAIARAVLLQSFDSEGKRRVMVHPKGFR